MSWAGAIPIRLKPAKRPSPYALTNPILVDVDGNGRFGPLGKAKVLVK